LSRPCPTGASHPDQYNLQNPKPDHRRSPL